MTEMTTSRDLILQKLRAARRPFEDASPRPTDYLPAIPVLDRSPEALANRFCLEMQALKGEAWVVDDDQQAQQKIVSLLKQHQVDHALTWDFDRIPVAGLSESLQAAYVAVTLPDVHAQRSPAYMSHLGSAGAGISGADAAIAMTGTVILSSTAAQPRITTVLPPVWIVVITMDQLYPRLEDWLAKERAGGLQTVWTHANVAFVTGPSRTGDIEMELILGVHGPGTEYVIIKRR